jgi:hypothetical protein
MNKITNKGTTISYGSSEQSAPREEPHGRCAVYPRGLGQLVGDRRLRIGGTERVAVADAINGESNRHSCLASRSRDDLIGWHDADLNENVGSEKIQSFWEF